MKIKCKLSIITFQLLHLIKISMLGGFLNGKRIKTNFLHQCLLESFNGKCFIPCGEINRRSQQQYLTPLHLSSALFKKTLSMYIKRKKKNNPRTNNVIKAMKSLAKSLCKDLGPFTNVRNL